ncbi:hypothetical protein [Peptostreptococcus faecalis]|uniref:hypothetical protein n=1 Tax=Peptostreptococcus faecalis TaxID=2045015 RepID=UPI000C7E7C7C|nr:hypothetical protein [Peptostreptococcus faecalis]
MEVNKKIKNLGTVIKCHSCGSGKIVSEYYKTNNKFNADEGYLPICKKCLSTMFSKLIKLYEKDIRKAFMHLCMMMDFEINQDAFDKNIDKENPEISILAYFDHITRTAGRRKITSMNEESIHSIIELSKGLKLENNDYEMIIESFEVTPEMYKLWGKSYTKEEIYFLEEQFEEIKETHSGKTPMEFNWYRDYAVMELNKRKAQDAGEHKEYMAYNKAQSSLMKEAGLNPSKNDMAESDSALAGMMAKALENEAPIGEVSEDFNDVDKIEEYMNTLYCPPLARSIGGVLK